MASLCHFSPSCQADSLTNAPTGWLNLHQPELKPGYELSRSHFTILRSDDVMMLSSILLNREWRYHSPPEQAVIKAIR
jgi:hypothetical protein